MSRVLVGVKRVIDYAVKVFLHVPLFEDKETLHARVFRRFRLRLRMLAGGLTLTH